MLLETLTRSAQMLLLFVQSKATQCLKLVMSYLKSFLLESGESASRALWVSPGGTATLKVHLCSKKIKVKSLEGDRLY